MHEPAVLVDVFAVHAFAVEPKALVDSDRARVVFEHVERDFVQAERPESITERGPHRRRPIAFRPERRFADHDPHVPFRWTRSILCNPMFPMWRPSASIAKICSSVRRS